MYCSWNLFRRHLTRFRSRQLFRRHHYWILGLFLFLPSCFHSLLRMFVSGVLFEALQSELSVPPLGLDLSTMEMKVDKVVVFDSMKVDVPFVSTKADLAEVVSPLWRSIRIG